MPKKVHDLALELISEGKDKNSAWAIATAKFGKGKKKPTKKK
jgi:hypothetical protein